MHAMHVHVHVHVQVRMDVHVLVHDCSTGRLRSQISPRVGLALMCCKNLKCAVRHIQVCLSCTTYHLQNFNVCMVVVHYPSFTNDIVCLSCQK